MNKKIKEFLNKNIIVKRIDVITEKIKYNMYEINIGMCKLTDIGCMTKISEEEMKQYYIEEMEKGLLEDSYEAFKEYHKNSFDAVEQLMFGDKIKNNNLIAAICWIILYKIFWKKCK